VELIASMVAFFALIGAWFILPSAPPATIQRTQTVSEPLATAA
jgi:hypothetical protein